MVTNHQNFHRLCQTIVILLVVLGFTATAQAAQENRSSKFSGSNSISASMNNNHSTFNRLLAQAKSLFATDGLSQPVNDKLQKALDEAEKNKNSTQVRTVIQEELSQGSHAEAPNKRFDFNERSLPSPVRIGSIPSFKFDDETPWKNTICRNNNRDQKLEISSSNDQNWELTVRLDTFTNGLQSINSKTAGVVLDLHLTQLGNSSLPVPNADNNLYPNGQQVPLVERKATQINVFTAKCDGSTLTMPKTNLAGQFTANLIFTVSATPQ